MTGLLAAQPATAAPPDAHALFDQAVAADLGHDPDATAHAFALYRDAAASGLAEAQLNVAVMYDSGRGTKHDAAQAATWYAASASGGMARAAFDLGQLYAAGDGVPRNPALAQAWFKQAATEGLRAAADRQDQPPAIPDAALVPPALSYPAPDATLQPPEGGLALVWTAMPAPAIAAYFVQVVRVVAGAPEPVFSAGSDVSAIRMPTPKPGRYAWRVFLICPSLGRYAPSVWAGFSIA